MDDQDKLIDAGIYLISKMDDQQRSDWLFLSSWMLNGIPLEQRKAILQHMKATGGDIDLQTLTNLGVYTQADAAAGYTADVFGGLLKENYGKNFVDSLRKEYQSHQLGTSFAEMNQEEMNLRIAQIGGLLAENIANVANGIAFGKNSRFFGNGKFDQLESTGYAGPSHVPGSQTAVDPSLKYTKEKNSEDSSAYTTIERFSAEEVNQSLFQSSGYEAPYAPNTTVNVIKLHKPRKVVRVYDGKNSKMHGGWVMNADDIVGLSAKEIQEKFALPFEPKYICDVEIPEGSMLRVGTANALFGFQGGGKQYDLMGQMIGHFTNERLIGEK